MDEWSGRLLALSITNNHKGEYMDETLMAGKWEMSIGNTLISAKLLGDITPNYAEGTVEAKTQAGTRKQPSGKAETAELAFTVYLPNLDYLKVLWADAYQKPTAEAQKTGAIVFGSNSCSMRKALPVNIHPVCEKTDDNDIHIFAGLVNMSFNPTLSTTDAVSIEATLQMQPTDNGYLRVGTGDLAKPSKWDVTTQKTIPVTGH